MARSSNLSLKAEQAGLIWVESQCPWLAHIGIPCVHPLPLPLPALLAPVELAAGSMGGPGMTRRVDTTGWIQTLLGAFCWGNFEAPSVDKCGKICFMNLIIMSESFFLCSQNCLHP